MTSASSPYRGEGAEKPSRSSTTARSESSDGPQITLRGLILGALTIGIAFYYAITEVRGMGGFVQSQVPILVFVPFVLWLFLNVVLKRISPTIALKRGELLTIFYMLWVVGTVPQVGWSMYWVMVLATPTYFASAENQWAEVVFDYLPWHVFPETSARVIDGVWQGLPEGSSIPWEGWLGALGQWLGVSIAMVVFGYCLVVLLQRQWEDGEKLTFPLAQLPLDLTAGFDGERRMPDIFRSGLFWLGFFAVFGVFLFNMGSYFVAGLPKLGLYWERYAIELGEPFPVIRVRIMPIIIGLTYLCPLDILGSMFALHLLAVGKGAAMERVGISLGAEDQPMNWGKVLHMESYGAMIFIGLWTIWLARNHLRQVWWQVRSAAGPRDEVVRYRLALAGLVLSGLYVISWMTALGMSLLLATFVYVVMVLTYLVIVKLIATTGCGYLLADWSHMKAETFVQELVGTVRISPQSFVAYRVISSRAFFGNLRIPAWPALPHILRVFSLKKQPRWVAALVFVAFPVGFLLAVGATLEMGYTRGTLAFSASGTIGELSETTRLLNNPRSTDLDRWAVFSVGFLEATALAFMRARLHWFPLHPVGLAFQYTIVNKLYWFSLFLVWLVKLTLLRYGGVRAYRAGKPFFYGLAIGYVAGVIASVTVDLIWFPAGHLIHTW